MNTSENIKHITSGSFTDNNEIHGQVWYQQQYYFLEDLGSLTLKESTDDED